MFWMIKTNMHIHSKYSWDSNMEIEDIARVLVENNIEYAALTDRVEFDREDPHYVLNKLASRHIEIKRINEEYHGKLKLLEGVEISEPHWYSDKVELLLEHADLDFTIGSIHSHVSVKMSESQKRYVTFLYYKEMLKMIEKGNFDVLGHIDYINRYYGQDYSDSNQIQEILEAVLEHHKIIEINTSAERRAGLNTFPNIHKLCHYQLLGGKYITIGTDAHRVNELVDNLEQAESISQEIGLEPVIFQKRKQTRI